MTQEDKDLLLKDLCARSYYWPKITPKYGVKAYIYGIKNTNDGLFLIQEIEEGHDYNIVESIDEFKVYLRPMSSMTEEEKEKLKEEHKKDEKVYAEVLERIANGDKSARGTAIPHFAADWCNKNHFDYRGLIPMGLALETKEGMYIKK